MALTGWTASGTAPPGKLSKPQGAPLLGFVLPGLCVVQGAGSERWGPRPAWPGGEAGPRGLLWRLRGSRLLCWT